MPDGSPVPVPQDASQSIPEQSRESAHQAPIAPEKWVPADDDDAGYALYVSSYASDHMVAITAKRPQRFRQTPRWQSSLALLIVCVAIIAACAGTVQLGHAISVLRQSIPTATVVAPTTTPHLKATATTKASK